MYFTVMSHIFHKIFIGSIDFRNMFEMQLKIEVIIRNQTSTGKVQQILIAFIHLDVAEFLKSLPTTKIMIICSIISYFFCFLLNYTSTCVKFKSKRQKNL